MSKTPFIKQQIQHIRQQLAKPCIEFITQDFYPANERTQSWIGRVFLCRADEVGKVVDDDGNRLYPLAQFCLSTLPYVPQKLRHLQYLTVFMTQEFPQVFDELGKNGKGWLIREYNKDDVLVEYDFGTGVPKALPLSANYQPVDFPMWDSQDIADDVLEQILALEPQYPNPADEHHLDYHQDIAKEHSYYHKFGGYPSFCQSGIDFGDGYEFMFQISSDDKACFNVIDSGSLMFARNDKGDWRLYYDFY